MALTPNDIQNQKFESRMRGFDRSQVESFMSTVSEELTRVIGERNQLNEETESLRRQLGEYREREKTIGETLCALRELSEKMKAASSDRRAPASSDPAPPERRVEGPRSGPGPGRGRLEEARRVVSGVEKPPGCRARRSEAQVPAALNSARDEDRLRS